MHHLKKLTCRRISVELQQTNQEIQENPHLFVNSTFEFIADPDVQFHEIKEEFKRELHN
jgi:hypothetical protein